MSWRNKSAHKYNRNQALIIKQMWQRKMTKLYLNSRIQSKQFLIYYNQSL